MLGATDDQLYQAFCKLDYDHRTLYNKDEIDDPTYFLKALEEELISSSLAILINRRCNNIYSPGVMANGRQIFESFALISLLSKEGLSEDQLKIFRSQHFVVEYNNYKTAFFGEAIKEVDKKAIQDKYEATVDLYCRILGVTKRDIKKEIRDPLFFLFKKGRPTITPYQLVKKELGSDCALFYRFFSVLEHPFFGLNVLGNATSVIKKSIDNCLHSVTDYFSTQGELDLKTDYPTLSQEIDNPIFQPKIVFTESKAELMRGIATGLSDLPNGERDEFLLYFLRQMSFLYLDIGLCVSLGYSEQASIKYKPFLELCSAFYSIESSESLQEFKARKAAFESGSFLTVWGLLENKDPNRMSFRDKELKSAYESFYQKAYKVDFSTFKSNLLANSLYFLSPAKKSYDAVVEDFLSSFAVAESTKVRWRCLYKDSKDIGHTGGFLFDSDAGPWQADAPMVISSINAIFLEFVLLASQAPDGQVGKQNLDQDIQLFKKTIDAENLMFSEKPFSKDDLGK